jgi:hypothetical protein
MNITIPNDRHFSDEEEDLLLEWVHKDSPYGRYYGSPLTWRQIADYMTQDPPESNIIADRIYNESEVRDYYWNVLVPKLNAARAAREVANMPNGYH